MSDANGRDRIKQKPKSESTPPEPKAGFLRALPSGESLRKEGRELKERISMLVKSLETRDHSRETIDEIYDIGAPMVPELIRLLDYGDDDVEEAAVELLIGIGEPAALALMETLKDENRNIHAAWALARIGLSEEQFQAVTWLLKNGDDVQRRGAAIALNGSKHPEAVDSLIAALDDKWRLVADFAADSLLAIGVHAAPVLTEAEQKGSAQARELSAWVLSKISITTEQFEIIVGMVKQGKGWGERRWAASTLGMFKDIRAAHALREAALHDENEHVREAAARALIALGVSPMPEVIEALKGDARALLGWTLRELRKRLPEAITNVTEDDEDPGQTYH